MYSSHALRVRDRGRRHPVDPPNPATTLLVDIRDRDAVHLYGPDIIVGQLAGANRCYYMHDGLEMVRHPSARS